MNSKPLILIVGESGSGKTTIVEMLEEKHGLKTVQSYTTRKPRYEGESGHTFISDLECEDLKDVVTETYFHGNYYCVTKEQLDLADTYVIDIKGIQVLNERYKHREIITIVLKVSLIVRIIRMIKRGDGFVNIISRLINDYKEFKEIKAYAQYTIVNRNIENTVDLILKIKDIR